MLVAPMPLKATGMVTYGMVWSPINLLVGKMIIESHMTWYAVILLYVVTWDIVESEQSLLSSSAHELSASTCISWTFQG